MCHSLEYPLLNSILEKHGAEGEEELGQGQFALLLQNVLQELAEALAEKHTVLIQNIKIVNGYKLRKVVYAPLFFFSYFFQPRRNN